MLSQADYLLTQLPWRAAAPAGDAYVPGNALLRDQSCQFIPSGALRSHVEPTVENQAADQDQQAQEAGQGQVATPDALLHEGPIAHVNELAQRGVDFLLHVVDCHQYP